MDHESREAALIEEHERSHGEHAAIDALSSFRSLTRDIAARRGVRAAKWLGDGAMLVGVDVGPAIATGVELVARCDGQPLALRSGIAHAAVLVFDGDDYIGQPANLAARLCQAARPGELLALGYFARRSATLDRSRRHP